jgi:hypothetical protein
MTRVVQNMRTKLFLSEHGAWVRQKAEAANFGSVVEAVLFCREHGITSDVHLVLGLGTDTPGGRTVDVPFPLFPDRGDTGMK